MNAARLTPVALTLALLAQAVGAGEPPAASAASATELPGLLASPSEQARSEPTSAVAPSAAQPQPFDLAAATADTCRGHERNRERYLAALDTIVNRRELSRVEEFYAADYRNNSGPPGAPQGPAAIRHYLTLLSSAFPDRRVENVMLLCAGDFVIVRSVVTGTHRGDYFGKAATGRSTRVMGTDIYRMRDGMLAERWGNEDALGLERQLTKE